MLVIENTVINNLVYNNSITERFPFIKTFGEKIAKTTKKAGCTPCQQKAISNNYNSIKAAIATMSPADKADFKKLVKADQVKVVYAVGATTNSVVF